MSFLKKHAAWILGFGALYLAFLWPLFAMQKGFTQGDYDLQFYPWTRLFAEELRAGRFALWTPLIQCGFPLFAEGQTAMLYLPNLLLFVLPAPFDVAYNAMFLIHFLLGGLFSYAFARKRGISEAGSAIFALAFTFGSSYAGCFYNIASMRTLVWFPALLWLIEHGFGALRGSWVWWLYAIVLSQSLLGGFLQTAVYGMGFALLYFALRFRVREGTRLDAYSFLAANALAVFIASPQLWASLELAAHSTRSGLPGADFALWGSAEPWTFATLFMASWGSFVASGIYIGLAPFLFLCYRLKGVPRDAWILLVVSVFLALGKYNPLWQLALNLPIVGMLRNPSKFLFFTSFFLAFIASGSYDKLVSDLEGGFVTTRRQLKRLAIGCAVILAAALAAAALVRVFEPAILSWGRDYVEEHIFGKPFHRLSMDAYMHKISVILGLIKQALNPLYPFFWLPFAFAAFALARMKYFRSASKANFHASIILLLCIDLFVYGKNYFGSGFVGNLGPFPDTAQYSKLPKDGRYAEFAAASEEALPASRSMLYGIPVVGAYSPLVDKSYAQYVKRLGAVDDSFGRDKPDPLVFLGDDPLLDALAVKYVLSDKKELRPSLRLIGAVDGRFLFVNTQVGHEAFLKMPRTPNMRVTPYTRSKDGLNESYRFNSLSSGDFVRVVTHDPGWKATVDGYATPIERSGKAFQKVPIEKTGEHNVTFNYAPNWFIYGFWLYAIGLAAALSGLIHSLITRKRA